MKQIFAIAALAAASLSAAPAAAEVTAKSDVGFAVRHQAEIKATPDEVWARLSAPNTYWDPQYSFTGNAANFFLDLQAGGCFCERIREAKGGEIRNSGSVQHMQVVYVEPPKVLRMVGALGPLQSEGVTGTLSIGLKAVTGGTQVTFEYVVGGFMRYPTDDIAPAVDKVIGQQVDRLAKLFDGKAAAPAATAAGKSPAKPAGASQPALAKPAPAKPKALKPDADKPAPK